MPRFFAEGLKKEGETILLTGDDASHIALSLRMKVGDTITVCDGKGKEAHCVTHSLTPTCVTAEVLSLSDCLSEPPFFAMVLQALPKGDKLDTVIQKAVETGASEIVPFESARCVVRSDPSKAGRLNERRSRIALEAAKQCGRGVIPPVRTPLSFRDAVRLASEGDVGFLCYEGQETVPLGNVLCREGKDFRFLIGPEGGFSEEEVREAQNAGLMIVGLGRRILRTETAASFVLSCLTYEKELKT